MLYLAAEFLPNQQQPVAHHGTDGIEDQIINIAVAAPGEKLGQLDGEDDCHGGSQQGVPPVQPGEQQGQEPPDGEEQHHIAEEIPEGQPVVGGAGRGAEHPDKHLYDGEGLQMNVAANLLPVVALNAAPVLDEQQPEHHGAVYDKKRCQRPALFRGHEVSFRGDLFGKCAL